MGLPGKFGANQWVLSQRTHTLPGGFSKGELMGTFKKYPTWTRWVKWGQIVSELTMNSQCTSWVSDPLPPVSTVPLVVRDLRRQPSSPLPPGLCNSDQLSFAAILEFVARIHPSASSYPSSRASFARSLALQYLATSSFRVCLPSFIARFDSYLSLIDRDWLHGSYDY